MVMEECEAIIEVLQDVKKSDIDPLTKFGRPEEVVGKKYDEWNVAEFQKAAQIFAPKVLEEFIAKKEIPKMYEMESTEV
jgi:uncharacterized protein (DUF4213/DUF364 family)